MTLLAHTGLVTFLQRSFRVCLLVVAVALLLVFWLLTDAAMDTAANRVLYNPLESVLPETLVLIVLLPGVGLMVVDKQRWPRWRYVGAVAMLATWMCVVNVLVQVGIAAVMWYGNPVVHWVCCSGTPYQRFYTIPKPLCQPSPPPAPVIDHSLD